MTRVAIVVFLVAPLLTAAAMKIYVGPERIWPEVLR